MMICQIRSIYETFLLCRRNLSHGLANKLWRAFLKTNNIFGWTVSRVWLSIKEIHEKVFTLFLERKSRFLFLQNLYLIFKSPIDVGIHAKFRLYYVKSRTYRELYDNYPVFTFNRSNTISYLFKYIGIHFNSHQHW